LPRCKKLPAHWTFWSKCDSYPGVPIVSFLITTDGRTSKQTVLRSSGCKEADQELLSWIKEWTYHPARCGEVPVAYSTTYSINWHPDFGPSDAAVRDHVALDQEWTRVWGDLLDAALGKAAEDKAFVQEIAKQHLAEPEGALAKLLLEEWDVPHTAEEIQEPRVIVAPKPDYSDLVGRVRLQSPVIAATGQVTALGAVQDIELKIGSGVEEIDQRCLDAFSRWRYRPAWGDCGYVTSNVAVTCHVHPR